MVRRGMPGLTLMVVGVLPVFAVAGWADEFDRLDGTVLVETPRNATATAHKGLTLGAVEGLPNVLRETRSALVVAATDQGNYARLLVVPGFRKPPGGAGKPAAVVVLERFDTFESGNPATRLAHGKDLILFDGFQLDLDSGQVVPEGQGGDLQFLIKGEGGPRLVALGATKLFTFTKSPLPVVAAGAGAKPSIGRTVLPGDFAGRFRLFSNGQWSGTLDLKAGADRVVSGTFRSDLNGTSYPVSGAVAAEVPQKITFTVKYPRTRQDFEGLLWTEGKGAMAGTVTMLEHAYGFFALREGGRFAPEGEDVGPVGKEAERPGRKVVRLEKGEYTLDGAAKTDLELTEALKKAVAADPASWVLLQVSADEPFAAVNRAFEVLSAAGVAAIRLGAAD